MDLSIVIVSWNTCQFLKQCMTSLYAAPPTCQFEVFVADNGSYDGSVEMVKRLFPQVRLFENRRNLGFAEGNNLAIHHSSGRLVLLLNPDTEVRPGAVDRLVRFMDEQPRVGAAGARLLNPDGSLQISCYPSPTLARELWRLFHLDRFYPYAAYPMDVWQLDAPRFVDVLMGACLVLRRAVLDQVGLLDEAYFMYSEEVDLCYRVHKAGWKLAWVPQAQVVHHGGRSTQQVANEMFLRLYEGKIRYFRKHYGGVVVLVYKLILGAASLGRILLAPFAGFFQPSQRQRHLKLFHNYRRLLLALPEM